MINRDLLERYLKERLQLYFGEGERSQLIQEKEYEAIQRKVELYHKRNISLVKVYGNLEVNNSWSERDVTYINYTLHTRFFLKQTDLYFEENQEARQVAIGNEEILYDIAFPIDTHVESFDIEEDDLGENETFDRNNLYNRFNAVKYAETWWDGHNKEYPLYANDCTNFISQCLRAGGLKMIGMPKPGVGWWYKNHSNSSYSWRVAHALRRFLPMPKNGIKAEEVPSQMHLSLGDIILYDFEGDGVWNHCTIVVAKDENGEPLVNAHTVNSRKRYWSYYDSSAFTENIKYKFFHIIDGFSNPPME
ncbi:amidase domain-containing protein [Bacillus sp. AFS041924]|uniref:amidase domain-containing protein n=1 Tax=Bacillus sp. AFS041924 TaxID=2033503 RepID=UPI00159BE109|nr:amidase domain-containing protein [Bacillus sp. AFS041924]